MSTSLTLFQGTFVRLPQCIMGYLKDWIHVLYYLCYLECMQNAQAYCSSVNVYTCWTKLKYNLLHLLVWLRKNQTSISSLTEIKLHVSVPIFKLNLVKLFFFFFFVPRSPRPFETKWLSNYWWNFSSHIIFDLDPQWWHYFCWYLCAFSLWCV